MLAEADETIIDSKTGAVKSGFSLVTATLPAAMAKPDATLVTPFVAAKTIVIVSLPLTKRLKVSNPESPVPLMLETVIAVGASVVTEMPVVELKSHASLVLNPIVEGETPPPIVAEVTVGDDGGTTLSACSMTPPLDNHTFNHLQNAARLHLPKTSRTPAPKLSAPLTYP